MKLLRFFLFLFATDAFACGYSPPATHNLTKADHRGSLFVTAGDYVDVMLPGDIKDGWNISIKPTDSLKLKKISSIEKDDSVNTVFHFEAPRSLAYGKYSISISKGLFLIKFNNIIEVKPVPLAAVRCS